MKKKHAIFLVEQIKSKLESDEPIEQIYEDIAKFEVENEHKQVI